MSKFLFNCIPNRLFEAAFGKEIAAITIIFTLDLVVRRTCYGRPGSLKKFLY